MPVKPPLHPPNASRRKRSDPRRKSEPHVPGSPPRLTVGRLQEGAWLFLLVATPLIINPSAVQVFDLPKVSLLRSVVFGMAAFWLWCRLSTALPRFSGKLSLPWADPRLWAAVLSLIAIAATITSIDVGLSFWGSYSHQEGLYTTIAYLLLFVLVASHLHDPAQGERVALAVALGSIPVIVYGLLQWAGIDPVNWQTTGRTPILSTIGRSNFVGSYLVLSLPLAVGSILLTSRLWLRAVLALDIFGSLALLWAAKARSAWLAILVAIVVLAALRAMSGPSGKDWRRRFALRAALPAVLALLTAAALLGGLLATGQVRDGMTLRIPELTGSLAARITIWQASLRLIAERPVLGFGPDSFTLAFYHVFPPELVFYQGRAITDRAHDVVLDQGVAAGIAGIGAYLALIASIVLAIGRRIGMADRRQKVLLSAICAAVLGHLVDLLSGFEVASTAAVFWITAGAGVALSRARAEDRPVVTSGRRVPAKEREAAPSPVLLGRIGEGRMRAPGLATRMAAGTLAAATIAIILISNIAPVIADTYAGLALRPEVAIDDRLTYAERSVALWPPEPGHLVELGLLYLARAQTAADPLPYLQVGQQQLEKAVAMRPLDPLAWSALGDVRAYWAVVRRDENAFKAAEIAYRRAIELAPTMATLHASYGGLQITGGRFEVAVGSLERATGLDTTDARAWGYLAEAYRGLGRTKDADQAFAIAQVLAGR